jgi:hypothetical protein
MRPKLTKATAATALDLIGGLAPAAHKAPAPAMQAEISAARLSERIRVSQILECEAAKGRETLALEIALRSNLDAETAEGLLRAAPIANDFGAMLLANATNIGPAASALDPLVQLDKRQARIAELQNVRGGR